MLILQDEELSALLGRWITKAFPTSKRPIKDRQLWPRVHIYDSKIICTDYALLTIMSKLLASTTCQQIFSQRMTTLRSFRMHGEHSHKEITSVPILNVKDRSLKADMTSPQHDGFPRIRRW